MILEMHDADAESLVAIIREIDYAYQAEMWVAELVGDVPSAIRWILFSAEGLPLRAWERQGASATEVPLPGGIVIDPRSLLPKS